MLIVVLVLLRLNRNLPVPKKHTIFHSILHFKNLIKCRVFDPIALGKAPQL